LRRAGLNGVPLRFYDHHRCHATAAAFTSGFDSCVVLTIDGLGDGAASTVNVLRHGRLDLVASTPAWHSPGVFFEHVTHLLNMRELEDEGKVMALADYASPVDDAFNPMLGLLRADGLSFATPVPSRRLAGPLRKILWRFPNEQFAFMAQRTLERACTSVADHALRATGERRIALAGGVASNIKINRRIRLLEGVDDVYVFPHMGDGGLALGAALQAVTDESAAPRLPLEDLGLGPAYLDGDVAATLQAHQLTFRPCANIASTVADLVATDQVVLWFQGAMEYGPRALGHRSVLARPDRPRLRDRLNLVLKRRVWYQPFCPSILERDARAALSDFTGRPNRHMTMAYQVAESHREALAGVMNVDGSCRPQMVAEDDPDIFAELLRAMRQRIGIGALLNTSFNLHGEPLVCTPDQAVRVFIETGADALAIGRFLVHRPA
jgi:carbamoyltransferase